MFNKKTAGLVVAMYVILGSTAQANTSTGAFPTFGESWFGCMPLQSDQ